MNQQPPVPAPHQAPPDEPKQPGQNNQPRKEPDQNSQEKKPRNNAFPIDIDTVVF